MRISIWQQFSSNHSANFTVVGEFRTEADALTAYEIWHVLMVTIAEWHQQNRGNLRRWVELSPQEEAFRKRYNLNLDDDPMEWFGEPEDLPCVLFQDGNRVFVETDFDTRNSPDIALKIMEAFGGKVLLRYDDDTSKNLSNNFLIKLSCSAPDEPLVQALYDEIIDRARLETWGISTNHPWEIEDEYGGIHGYTDALGMHIEGHKLLFELVFHDPLKDFVPMLTYLKSKGFSEITYEFEDLWKLVHVEGTAPSEAKAKQIEAEIQKCVENNQPLPWQVEFQHMIQENPQIEVLRQNEHLAINIVSKWLSEWDVIKHYLWKNGFNSKEIKWKTTPILEFDMEKILRGRDSD